jgi:A/G-specific adenine glycosylase
LAWYDRHRRRLPWRAAPGVASDPYAVWLSEIMLQQTTVAAVKPYFERFLARWPTVFDLAATPPDEVLTAWAGLGYYSRARNLHRCAQAVVRDHGGVFPDGEAALRDLPGIGGYTAAAMAAIAFGRRAVVVDGNVERVMARFHAVRQPLPAIKPRLKALADAMTPDRRSGDYAQAVMDLGATVCTPKSPACDRCPIAARCLGRAKGIAGSLPRRLAKKPVPTRHGVAFWITRPDGAVLLRRRPDKGLLGGMIEIPSSAWSATPAENPESDAPIASMRWAHVPGRVKHTFTHFHLALELRTARVSTRTAKAFIGTDVLWAHPREFARLALPNVMKKVVSLAMKAVGS